MSTDYRYEVLQGNTVSSEALEQLQISVEGIAILIDCLITSIDSIGGIPTNIDSVRRIISDQLDTVSEDLHKIVRASEGKTITIE